MEGKGGKGEKVNQPFKFINNAGLVSMLQSD